MRLPLLAPVALLALLELTAVANAGVKAGPTVVGRHHRLGPGGAGQPLAGAGLDYNFQTGQYFQAGATPGVTVTRASSKRCDDNAGNWSTVANNVLCATNKGALIEEARTNLFLNSAVPVTQTITVVSTSVYTASLIGTGTVTLSGAGTGVVSQGSPVTFTASSTSLTATVAGTGGVFVNAQVELGAFRTSPILTTGAAATRAADVVTVTTPPTFGSAYTLFVQGTPIGVSGAPIMSVDNGTTSSRSELYRETTLAAPSAWLQNAGTVVWDAHAAGTWGLGASKKLSGALAPSDQGLVFSGGTPLTNATGTPFVGTQVHVGARADGLVQCDCYVERIALWPTTRLPNATLQSLTQ